MDFKSLGTSLLSESAEERLIDYFKRKQMKLPLISSRDMSSASLVTRNINYKSSSSMGREQTLNIYIDGVHFKDSALKSLNGKYRKCLGIRVCWHFMSFESTTPIIQVKEKFVRINDTQKYNITLSDALLSYISKKTINFELYGTYDLKEKHLGRAEMDLQDLLFCPDKTIPKYLDILTVHKSKMFKKCRTTSMVGNLALKYCLKSASSSYTIPKRISNIEVKELYHNVGKKVSSDMLNIPDEIEDDFIFTKKPKKNSPISTVHGFCQSIINNILNGEEFEDDDVTERRQKMNFKRSLEEYAVLSGLNPKNIGVPTSNEITVRNYEKERTYEPAVIINIISLYMNEVKYPKIMTDSKELYVEYSFLSRSGKDMETISMPLLDDRVIEFNFKRTFFIDSENNKNDCKALAKLIKENKSIRFLVIEEPQKEVNKFQICNEIGFAEVNLFKLVQGEENMVIDLYPIVDINNNKARIGYLKISVYGIQAIRNAALKVLGAAEKKIEKDIAFKKFVTLI